MNKYLIMPNNGRWYPVEAMSAELAYRSQCCWFSAMCLIAVMNIKTGEIEVFHRELDTNGNEKKLVKGVIYEE